MPTKSEITAQKWEICSENYANRNTSLYWWEAGAELQNYINARITGDPNMSWMEYTLQKYFEGRLPLNDCLSLGCGEGHLERSLAQLNAFQHCDAYDISESLINNARRLAAENGINSIEYHLADVNKIELPINHYDAVWSNTAMHHFESLEFIRSQVKKTLKPGGLLILNEYIGPNRFQFPARQKQVANLCLQLLPIRYRTIIEEAVSDELNRNPSNKGMRWFFSRIIDKIRDRELLSTINRRVRAYRAKGTGQKLIREVIDFPTERDVIADDPSEAVRSEDILNVIKEEFGIVEVKGWGGNIFQFLLAGIVGNFSHDESSKSLLKMIINIEDTLLNCGEFDSDFAYIVARPM